MRIFLVLSLLMCASLSAVADELPHELPANEGIVLYPSGSYFAAWSFMAWNPCGKFDRIEFDAKKNVLTLDNRTFKLSKIIIKNSYDTSGPDVTYVSGTPANLVIEYNRAKWLRGLEEYLVWERDSESGWMLTAQCGP